MGLLGWRLHEILWGMLINRLMNIKSTIIEVIKAILHLRIKRVNWWRHLIRNWQRHWHALVPRVLRMNLPWYLQFRRCLGGWALFSLTSSVTTVGLFNHSCSCVRKVNISHHTKIRVFVLGGLKLFQSVFLYK